MCFSFKFQPIVPRFNNKMTIHTTFLAKQRVTKQIPHNVTYLSLRNLTTYMNDNNNIYGVFEYRPTKYMFGSTNYGEIPNIFNRADDCGWDIIAPGYEKLEIEKEKKISSIYNVLILQNGNHKVVVKLENENNYCAKKAAQEMQLFSKTYYKHTRVRCKWLYRIN